MAALNRRRMLLLRNNLLRLLLLRRRQKQRTRYKKRFWIRRIYAERQQKEEFHLLVKELSIFDHEYFFQCFRMSPGFLDELLFSIGPHIQKKNNKSGDAQTTTAASYRISPAVVGRIIAETCELLWKTMIEKGFLKMPCTVEDWKIIAHEFEKYWNFPHCIRGPR